MSVIITYVDLGRAITADERTAMKNELAKCVSAGTTDGSRADTGDLFNGGPMIQIWTTQEAADGWVAFCNTFTPLPVESFVTTVGS